MPDDTSAGASPKPDQSAGLQQMREVEIKLSGPAGLLRKVFTLAPFAGVRAGRGRAFETTYFDTADGALGRAGMALRTRRIGARRLITLKWTVAGESGLFSRGEQEAPLESDDLRLAALGAAAQEMIETATRGAALAPCSATRFTRRVAMVESEGARIEVALDRGEIIVGDRTAPIAELELELKSGPPAALYGFAASLVDEGLRIAPAPKGLRGRWLATGEQPREVRVTLPDFSPGEPLDDVIGAVIEANVAAFVANWPALSPDCPEAVHQMRVALRRLRAALALFHRAMPHDGFQRLRAEAKRIASALGPARDQDVLQTLVEEGPVAALGRDASFDALLAASAARREKAYADARALIEAPATSRFVLDAYALSVARGWRPAAPDDGERIAASAFAERALDRLDKRARKRGKGLVDLAPEERHEARIALKNLRYGADFFAPLFEGGRAAKKFLRTIAALQDALGAYNDSIVARQIVADLEAQAGPGVARAGGAVAGWTARGAVDADERLADAWKAFRKSPRFWR